MKLKLPKNNALRKKIADRLREMRTWPPLSAGTNGTPLKRPLRDEVLATMFGPQTLAALIEQGCSGLEYRKEAELLAMGQGSEACTQVLYAGRKSPLHEVVVRADCAAGPSGEPEESIVLYRSRLATDRQYDAYLEPLWQQYVRDSQVSDETDAQYREFLRLRRIYEPDTVGTLPS